jgi:hypothetical protein
MGLTTALGNVKIFSDLTTGLYIRGLVSTTFAGASYGIAGANQLTTAINQQIVFEQYNGVASSWIVM